VDFGNVRPSVDGPDIAAVAYSLIDDLSRCECQAGSDVRGVFRSGVYSRFIDWSASRVDGERPAAQWIIVLRQDSAAIAAVGEQRGAWRLGDVDDLDYATQKDLAPALIEYSLEAAMGLTFHGGPILNRSGELVARLWRQRVPRGEPSRWVFESPAGRRPLTVELHQRVMTRRIVYQVFDSNGRSIAKLQIASDHWWNAVWSWDPKTCEIAVGDRSANVVVSRVSNMPGLFPDSIVRSEDEELARFTGIPPRQLQFRRRPIHRDLRAAIVASVIVVDHLQSLINAQWES